MEQPKKIIITYLDGTVVEIPDKEITGYLVKEDALVIVSNIGNFELPVLDKYSAYMGLLYIGNSYAFDDGVAEIEFDPKTGKLPYSW